MSTGNLALGEPVRVAEFTDPGREHTGRSYPARVCAVEGNYVQVFYDDPAVYGGRPDVFWASSGWRAWDGEMRWRIEASS